MTGEIPEDERILNDFKSDESQKNGLDSIQSRGVVEEVVEEEVQEEAIQTNSHAPDHSLPEVRQGGSKQLVFSERVHPNMPARESHKKEPPMPKSKKLKKNTTEEDINFTIEDKDPVWLKDKGDHFFKRHDFNSAMNAYTKSIKNDPEFLQCYLNRATACIKMHNFEGAILDLDDIEKKINSESEEELKDPFYARMMARVLVKRAA